MKLAFIGAGSMAEAMIHGLTSTKNTYRIAVTNRSDEHRLAEIQSIYSVQTTYNTAELLHDADLVVLAMKPKDAADALQELHSLIPKNALVLSILAGLSLSFLEEMISSEHAIARAMPNTSAAIQQSATGVAFNRHVTAGQKEAVVALLKSIGTVTCVSEEQLDLVTGLAGSGPAYIYYVVEALEQAALENGLSAEEAKPFILQTLSGAAQMLQQSDKSPARLRRDITSPGGTTEAGIGKLEEHGVNSAIRACVKEATVHSGRLRALFEGSRTTH